jgi:hypothetical protein
MLRRVVWYEFTDVSEAPAAAIIRAISNSKGFESPNAAKRSLLVEVY